MKGLVRILVVCFAMSGLALAQSVVGTDHDMSGNLPTSSEVCVFCHTPHQPDSPFYDTDPLWNHTESSVASYGVYGSDTLDAVPTAVSGTDGSVSALCMSCHDGTVGLGSLYNAPNLLAGGEEVPSNASTLMTGNALVGTDMSNDHPVNFVYDSALVAADGGLKDPSTIAVPLFGGTVQCASCHNPHDNTFGSFLLISNAGSALCLECHDK